MANKIERDGQVTHGVTAVAELKADRASRRWTLPPSHPRRHRRGRIEGTGLMACGLATGQSPTASPPWPN